MAKNRNLQPWLEYFEMLRTYEQKGFLEVLPDKHEAYVTRAALHTLSPGDPLSQIRSGELAGTLRRLHAYAAWMSREGEEYLKGTFALHVVKEDPPHDLAYTLVISAVTSWRRLYKGRYSIEVIDYSGRP